jgi:hypothetical protein
MSGLSRAPGAILLLIFTLLFSGCFIFRKKNKCGGCPTWSKSEILQSQSPEKYPTKGIPKPTENPILEH